MATPQAICSKALRNTIAITSALDAPNAVHALALLEPALLMVPSAKPFFEAMAPAIAKYAAGDPAGAVDGFISLVGGPDWRSNVSQMIPGAPEQAEKDAATFFEVELPALGRWSFDAARARQISQPAIYVIGTESGVFSEEGKRLCESWMPQTEGFTVAGATHLLHQESPRASAEVARGLAEFFARHPMI